MDQGQVKEILGSLTTLSAQFAGLAKLGASLGEAKDVLEQMDTLRGEHSAVVLALSDVHKEYDEKKKELKALAGNLDKTYKDERHERDAVLATYIARRSDNALRELQHTEKELKATIDGQINMIENYKGEIAGFHAEHQSLAKDVEHMNTKFRKVKAEIDSIKSKL